MSAPISLSRFDRSIYSVISLLTSVLAVLATASIVHAQVNTTDQSLVPRECGAIAVTRWLPRSTIAIKFARGEFTKDERAEFHRAIRSWQHALQEMNLGIVLEERGEIEGGVVPDHSQIIVKRDYSMDSGHYGKIVAATRPDNYLDRAFILINGSLRKRSSLRKTLLHELGHAFGLKDCPNCRSGATVMNYFSQQSVVGFNFGKAGRRISDRPTKSDIAAVASGYRQSPQPFAHSRTGEKDQTRTLDADEAARGSAAAGDLAYSNIIAEYLTARSELGTRRLTGPSYFESKIAREFSWFATGPYSKKPSQHQPAFSGTFFETASTLKLIDFRPRVENLPLMMAPHQPVTAEKGGFLDSSSEIKTASPSPASVNSIASTDVMAAQPPGVVSVSTTNQRVLTDGEKIEFESYIPTLLGKEAETMGELNNYTFTRDVRIQTIDKKGRVSGEYRRTSDILFDDSGARIERGLSSSKSTLRRLKISPEYVEDFSGVQLKGFELSRQDQYKIEPFMTDTVDGVRMRVYRMTPLNLNAVRAARSRVFYGYVWVEEGTGRIVKIGGCALPDGKQRFPLFETQRILVDGKHVFPLHTIADDHLVFSSHKVHVRMLITYSNYKRFESRVKIVEVDD